MAELNISRAGTLSGGPRREERRVPRILMRWEDWLTLVPALMVYLSVAYAARQADWVSGMPSFFPTTIGAMIVGLIAARFRGGWWYVHPIAIIVGAGVVVLSVQGYAAGDNLVERIDDFRFRMWAWIEVVRSGDVSNDDLPFITLVHGLAALAAYTAAWAIYRIQNAWLAIVPAGAGLLLIIATIDGQPGGAFVVFMLGALVLLSRMYLQRRLTQWERAGIDYPEFISLNVVQATVLIAVVLVTLSWMVPLGKQASLAESVVERVVAPITDRAETFARLFPGIETGASGNFHTFGDVLAIRGNVDIGARVIAEIEAEQGGFLRAASYDEYTGNGWRTSDRTTTEVAAEDFSLGGSAIQQYAQRQLTTLQVTSRDGENTLYSLGIPLGADRAIRVEGPEAFPGDIERVQADGGLSEGDTYTITGTISVATPEELMTASTNYPGWITERYLQLPDTMPDRVRAESERIVGDAGTSYEKAAAIEAYLRSLPFDLDVGSPPARGDVVDYFLFELQRGYFDYLSTAMAVMLRSVDVPSRVVVGFAISDDAIEDGSYLLRRQDAYSWVEVYFPEYGWVAFNPTPTLPGDIARPGSGGGGGGEGTGDIGDLPFNPDEFPVEWFDIPGLEDLTPGEIPGAPTETPEGDGTSIPWTAVWVVLGVGAVIGAGAVSGRVAWEWGLRGLEGTPRLWAKTQRLAGWAGIDSRETETPREWARRLGTTIEKDEEAGALREAYERERYAGEAGEDGEEAAKTAYVELRNALLGVIFQRRRGHNEREE